MSRSLDSKTVIHPARFAHAVLRTRHLEEAIVFYEKVLGAEIVFRNAMIAFLTYDEEHHRIALAMTPQKETAPPGAAGLDHLAYTYENLGQLLGTYERLRGEGILPVWSINHGPTTSLYYADPDGNRVELQIDNFDTEAELKAFMESGAFEKNPIGVEFDADKLLSRYLAGDSEQELVQQGSA
jgi:catechol-2,3-dioxygenase